MVLGVYHPEVSGASNQCRQLMNKLSEKFSFTVLTTTRDTDLPPRSQVDGVEVFRILLRKRSVGGYFKAILKFATIFFFQRKGLRIVHMHGFSYKSVFIMVLSKIFHKKVIIKMTSVGHDDPISCKKRGFTINYFFTRADVYVGMNPKFAELYHKSELPLYRYIEIPNGVDIDRFRPVEAEERETLQNQLGLPTKMKLILFVGHFSREKCPDILLEAWKQYVAKPSPDTGIIFVGSTNPDYYEVDAELVIDIQKLADPYVDQRIFFIERTQAIENLYRAVDAFVLPSLREGLPNSLLEAMACGLPVIVSRLDGITDWIIQDGVDGLLFAPGSVEELGEAMIRMLRNSNLASELGTKARQKIIESFTIDRVARNYESLYGKLVS
jgi:glycosyltransferase involved in cell wall biosynthesis